MQNARLHASPSGLQPQMARQAAVSDPGEMPRSGTTRGLQRGVGKRDQLYFGAKSLKSMNTNVLKSTLNCIL